MGLLPESITEFILVGSLYNYNTQLHPGAFDVLLAIMADSKNGLYSGGAKRLERLTGFSRTKVFQCLDALESACLIQRTKGHSPHTTYKVNHGGFCE